MNIELFNIFKATQLQPYGLIDAFVEMSYIVSSLEHFSEIFFVIFIVEAFIEYSNGIDRLLIEIFDKFILLMLCASLNSRIVILINLRRNV